MHRKIPFTLLLLLALLAGMIPAALAQGPVLPEEMAEESVPAPGLDAPAGLDAVSWRYEFSSSILTYTPLITGTVHGTASNDDTSFPGIDLGFTFTYDGLDYTQIGIQSNGWIAMGGGAMSSSYYPLSTGTMNNVVAALARDLQGNGTTSTLWSAMEGTAPNRVFTVQWTDYKRYGSAYAGDAFDFQIKLYETSNEIEIVYGDVTVLYVASPPYFPQVGLRGASNLDFNNRTTTADWANSLRGTANTDTMALTDLIYPPTGLTFNWSLFTGVVLDPPAQNGSACKGSDVVYNLALINLTGVTNTFDLAYTSVWSYNGPAVSPPLAPEEVWPFQVSVHIPWTANPGDQDTLTMTATGGGYTNNATATTIVGLLQGYQDYADTPRPTRDHALVYHDGKLYKIGGYDGAARAYLDIYDIATDTWTAGTDMPGGRYWIDCEAIGDGIYCAGGYLSSGQTTLYRYDIPSNSWATMAALPAYRYNYASATYNGLYYIIGGYAAGYSNATLVYDPATNAWTTLAPMSTPRRYFHAGAIGGKIYVAGGYSPTYLSSAEVYDIATNTWSPISSMPTTWLRGGDAVKHDRFLVIFGGDDNSTGASNPTVLIYDAVQDTWSYGPPMVHSLYGTEADGDGSDVWIVSGRLYEGGYSYSPYTTLLTQCPTTCTPVTTADFTWDPPFPWAGFEVTLNGTADGTPEIHYAWDLGDGSHAVGAVVHHTYPFTGTYTVVMSATNCDNPTPVVATHNVQVILPPIVDVEPDSLEASHCADEITTQELTICNLGEAPLVWELLERPRMGQDAALPVNPAPTVERPVITSPDQCAAYENYTGAEPLGAAEFCHPDIVPVPSIAMSPDAPTDIGYALDIGYISDNFVSFFLNDFPGQTVIGTNATAFYGMDFDPTGQTLYALNDATDELGTIDTASGAFTALVSCPPPVDNWTGLTIDPVNGTFYASDATSLYTIDPTTGVSTLVGAFGTTTMIAIAMNMDGEMYGHDITSDSIYSINPATGQATLIGPTGYAANYAQGMDFDNDDGTLYIFLYVGSGANIFGTVNLDTGAVTPLASSDPLGEFEGAIPTPPEVPWLSEDPITGTVPGGECATVIVTFDSTGLAPGDYFADLLVDSNDPVNPRVVVPVTLTVEPPMDIVVTAPPLEAELCPDEQLTLDMSICNVGGCDLTWELNEMTPTVMLVGMPFGPADATGGGMAPRAPAPGATGSRGGSAGAGQPIPYNSVASFYEGFDDIALLPGQGWFFQNNSEPLGVTDWFQGNDTVFPAHSGASTSYIGANYNNTAGVGTISNWMLTPEISLNNGDTISFWTRTPAGSAYPDRLELRLSTAGASTDVGVTSLEVGDFTTLLLSVNPDLVIGGYPEEWTQFSATLSGIPAGATGRVAFRYFVTDAGPSGNNSNYIGIDTVEYVSMPGVDIPWVSEDPTAGTLGWGECVTVAVTFDATGMPAGDYFADLLLLSNDPDTPSLTLPMTLTVNPPPDLEVTAPPLEAELCPDGTTAMEVNLCNLGVCTLDWALTEFTGTGVLAATPPATRSPLARRPVALSMSPDSGSVETNPPTIDAPVELILDDGSRDNDIGIGGTWEFIWVNRFTPDPGDFPFTLNQVQVYFTTAGMVNVGDDIIIVVYENTTGGYDPAPGSNWLYSYPTTVQALDAWNVYDLPAPVALNGPGDVIVGVIGLEVPGTSYWPASMDQTTTQQRSWAGWWLNSPPPDPPLLPPDDSWILIDDYFPGNWMVRGYGETGGGPPDDVPWLSEDPVAGSLIGGECVTVVVTFDSTGMAPGTYTAGLLITSNDPETPEITLPVTLTVLAPVTGTDFVWSPPTPLVDEVVYFTATAAGDPVITYEWDLGDGTMDSGEYVNHAYAAAGTYTVILTATNGCGQQVVTHDVTVAEACVPPAGADFSWTPTSPIVGEMAYFSGTVATGTAPLAYAWDLGDGTLADGQYVSHTYAVAGTYTVLLTVTNDCGEAYATYDVVVVEACTAPTGADFVWLPLNPFVGDTVTFTGTVAAGTEPITYAWEFGDGETGAGSPIDHTYAVSGTYTVVMTATNACGSDVATYDITVSAVGPTMYYIYLPIIVRP